MLKNDGNGNFTRISKQIIDDINSVQRVSLCNYRDRLIYANGIDTQQAAPVAKKFNIDLNSWQVLPAMNIAREKNSLCAFGGKVYAVGGYRPFSTVTLDSVEWLDICDDVFGWTKLRHHLMI